MNCPKCNSLLNEGDKFCQVCGSVVENNTKDVQPQTQPVVEATPVNPAPVEVAQPAPVVTPTPQQPIDVPMMAQPAPMPTPVPMVAQAPMNPIPAEPTKKNNTIVIILGVIIGLLVIALVAVILTSGSGDEKEGGSNNTGNTIPGPTENIKNDGDDEKPKPVDTTTKTVVNEFTFILPEGYNATTEENAVFIFDDNAQFEATVLTVDGYFSQLSVERVKSNMASVGITNVIYKSYTKNNKQMAIFTGTFQGLEVEYIYVDYGSGKIIGSCAIYKSTAHKETLYDILTKTTIAESGYSNTTSLPKPGLTLEDALK